MLLSIHGFKDLALASGHRRPGHRAHDAIAITEPAAGFASFHASAPYFAELAASFDESRLDGGDDVLGTAAVRRTTASR